MLYNKKISVIIPCRNEESALYAMLRKIPACVDEIIVVDNASTDNTVTVAKMLGARVFTEKRTVNGVGYGFAHQTGLKHAKGDIIVALDGDDTYPIKKIEEVVSYLEKSGADFVSCARFPLANEKAISPTRRLGIGILNLEVSLLYGYHIKDILSGMWVMRRTAAKKMNLTNGDWNFSPEVKLEAMMQPEIHFSEYHINHTVRLNGMSKQDIWKTGFSHLFYIAKRRFTQDTQVSHQLNQIAQAIQFTKTGVLKYATKLNLI